MKIRLHQTLIGLTLSILLSSPPVEAARVYYDFENDSGLLVVDKLSSDSQQNGVIVGNVVFQTAPPGTVPFGLQSALFLVPDPPVTVPPYSTLEIPSTVFGVDFSLTFAMHGDFEDNDFTRLVSSFTGTGPVGTDRLLLDFDPSGSVISGVRAIVANSVIQTVVVPPTLASPGYHHFALTIESGQVRIFIDGIEVASGNVGLGYSNAVNLHVGEDPHDGGGTADEQFNGNIDDVLITDQVLTPAEIASLASGVPVQTVLTPGPGLAVNYDFEGDSGTQFTDKFPSDGQQDGIGHADVVVDEDPLNARLGSRSGSLTTPLAGDQFSRISTPLTGTDLGTRFTLSAVINVAGGGFPTNGLTRLFSTHSGLGSPAGRMIVDFNPAADIASIGVRWILPDGTMVISSDPFSLNQNHTLSAVYDDGVSTLYFDGIQVASAVGPGGPVDLGAFMLQIGEDLNGPLNENLQGTLDDVLVLDRALTSEEILEVHQVGVRVFLGLGNASIIEVPLLGDWQLALLATLLMVVAWLRLSHRRVV